MKDAQPTRRREEAAGERGYCKLCASFNRRGSEMRNRELEPRVVPTGIDGLPGLEIWRFFDWFQSGIYCFPFFTISATVGLNDVSVSYRHLRRQSRAHSGILLSIPDQVLTIDDVKGVKRNPHSPTLLGIGIPVTIASESERRELQKMAVEPHAPAPQMERSLIDLVNVLESTEQMPCFKEERLRAFVERVLTSQGFATSRDVGVVGCHRALQRAREFIHANVARSFSLDEVACEASLTKWHLSRSFRVQFGLSMSEYARRVRAHAALDLMRSGMRPVQVSNELGYVDQAHLTRELRSLFGFTPGQYAAGHGSQRRQRAL